MAERRESDKGPPKRFANSEVKFLSSEEVISMSSETTKRRIKRTTTTYTSSIKAAAPSGDPTPTQTSVAKSDSETEPPLSAKKSLSGKLASASSSGFKEFGHKIGSLKGQLPYHLVPIAWKGSLEVHDSFGNTLVELAAYVPLQVSVKLLGAIETLPAKLQMKMVPHITAWPKQFNTDFPNLKDIGVFLLPLERSSRLKCMNLLRKLDSKGNALKMNVNASYELVVHSSQSLAGNSQRIEGELFFWGFIWKRKIRGCSKKKKFASADVTLGKTCSEFGVPNAQDKGSDVLKSNQVGMEAIVDASDVRGNNSLEKETVVDAFDVPLGFTKPPIGQEMSPMDRQSESSKLGKKTQLAYNEIAPGCSSNSYRTNEEGGRKQLFSSIGVGILEPTLEDCENQEECPEMPTNHIQNCSEQSKNISSMHASGEKQRVPNSLTTPDVKHKAFDPPEASFSQMVSQSRDEFNRLSAALYNASVPVLTPTASHFRGLNPSFLAGSSRDGCHSSINKKAADDAIVREEDSQRGYVRRSPVESLERSRSRSSVPRRQRIRSRSPLPRRHRIRSRSPVPRQHRSQSRSPVQRRHRSRSRSPVQRQYRSRSRSPVPRRQRSLSRSPLPRRHRIRSRSPVPRRHRSRSRSPVRRRHRSRSRSPVQRQHKSRSRSPIRRRLRSRSRSPGRRWNRTDRSRSKSPVSRQHKSKARNSSWWNRDPVYRRNMSWVRSPERAGNSHNCGLNSSQFKSRCRSSSRDTSASYDSSPSCRRGRDRSRSLSPSPPVESRRY